MGIVVTVAMLLGLSILRPTPWRNQEPIQRFSGLAKFTVVSLLVLGIWNVFWYGFRHLGAFWGWAAIFSGGAMMCAAAIILLGGDGHFPTWLKKVRQPVTVALALSFILYSVTIIQLNLGLPILGN